MSWHSLILTDLEFIEFKQAFDREYQREMNAGETRGYTLYGRKRDAGDHAVFVPPEALHIFEHIPAWKRRLRHHDAMPDLSGFKAVLVRQG
jgi:hypothetical protein